MLNYNLISNNKSDPEAIMYLLIYMNNVHGLQTTLVPWQQLFVKISPFSGSGFQFLTGRVSVPYWEGFRFGKELTLILGLTNLLYIAQ